MDNDLLYLWGQHTAWPNSGFILTPQNMINLKVSKYEICSSQKMPLNIP